MSWLEIFGWFLAFSIATSFWYRKGVKHGIHHALMLLDLDQQPLENLIYLLQLFQIFSLQKMQLLM